MCISPAVNSSPRNFRHFHSLNKEHKDRCGALGPSVQSPRSPAVGSPTPAVFCTRVAAGASGPGPSPAKSSMGPSGTKSGPALWSGRWWGRQFSGEPRPPAPSPTSFPTGGRWGAGTFCTWTYQRYRRCSNCISWANKARVGCRLQHSEAAYQLPGQTRSRSKQTSSAEQGCGPAVSLRPPGGWSPRRRCRGERPAVPAPRRCRNGRPPPSRPAAGPPRRPRSIA